MKISPPINAVAAELEMWALEAGWKSVGVAVAEQYKIMGGGDILPDTDTSAGIDNAVQRVKRIFRGFDGPRYMRMAEELIPAVLAALPTECRAQMESPGDPVVLAAVAAREGVEAVNAVNLGAAPVLVMKELNDAIAAFQAVRAVFEPLIGASNHCETNNRSVIYAQ